MCGCGDGFTADAICVNCHASVLSQMEALRADAGWRPIETAPKNGDMVLLYYVDGAVGCIAISGWWFSSPKQIDDGWETAIGFIGDPVSWMPWPALEARKGAA